MRYLVHGPESYMRAYLVARWKKAFPDYVIIDNENPLLFDPPAALVINWERWKKKALISYPLPEHTLFLSEKLISDKHAIHEVVSNRDNEFACELPTDENGWQQWIRDVARRNRQPITNDEIQSLLKVYGENTWRLGVAMEMRNKIGVESMSWEENIAMRIYEAWWNRDLTAMLTHAQTISPKPLQQRLLRIFQASSRFQDHALAINYLTTSWWNELIFTSEELGVRHNLINLYSLRGRVISNT